jgi:tetratricopeptide (TPR) repeat protein
MSLSDYGIQYLLEKAKSYERASSLPELDLALKYYNKIIDNIRPHPHYFFKRAKVKYSLSLVSAFHDLDDAIADLDRAIELEPDRGEYYRLRGEYLMLKLTEQQHTSDADRQPLLERIDRDYRSSRERNPTDPQLWLDLIEAAILSHDYDKAIGLYGDSEQFSQFFKTRGEKLVRSWLGCIALALAGDAIEERDNESLYKTGHQFDRWEIHRGLERVLEINALLNNIREKRSPAENWRKAMEIQRLFDDKHKFINHGDKKFDYMEKLSKSYNVLIELRCIDDIAVADLIVKSFKYIRLDDDEIITAKKKIEDYERSEETRDDSAKALYREGVSFSRQGRYEEALRAFDKIIRSADSPLAIAAWYYCKKEILYAPGRFSDEEFYKAEKILPFGLYFSWYYAYRGKIEECDKALKSGDIDLAAWYRKGVLFKSNGKHEEAIGAFDKVIESGRMVTGTRRPESDPFLKKLFSFSDRRNQEAISSALNPVSLISTAWFNKGVLLSELESFGEALDAYDKATENCHDDIMLAAMSCFNRGVIFQGLDRQEDALNAFEKAIELNPHFADAFYFQAGMLKHFMRYDEALESYDKAISSRLYHAYTAKGFAASVLEDKGDLLRDMMLIDEAFDAYDRAMKFAMHYSSSGIELKKAKLLAECERYDEALEICDKVFKVEDNQYTSWLANNKKYTGWLAESWHRKAVIYEKLNDYEKALDAYDRAIQDWISTAGWKSYADGSEKDEWFGKAALLAKLGRHEEARQAFEKAERLKSENKNDMNASE